MQDLQEAPFHVAEIFTDIDDCYGFFETLLTDISNEHAPFKTRNARPVKPAAMNKTWHKAVMTKARLRQMHDKYPTKANWEKYRVQRNLCAKLKRESVRCYFSERCGNDNNPSDFYKTVRPFYTNKGMGSSYHIQLLENDKIISDPTEFANVMNANFVTMTHSIGRPVERATLDLGDEKFIENSIKKHSNHPSIKLIHKHPEYHNNFSFKHLNPSEVGTILCKPNTKKAMDCDGLTAKLIKIAGPAISAPLSGIINHVFNQSKFPTHAKATEVGPIHKKDSQLDKNNYQSVMPLSHRIMTELRPRDGKQMQKSP